jgi:hypothetical protein
MNTYDDSHELAGLLHRWREDALAPAEMERFTAQLDDPQARAALGREWFLDAALPQALAASTVMQRAPSPSLAARCRAWAARWFIGEPPEAGATLLALRWWARGAFAAVALAAAVAWVVWPRSQAALPAASAGTDAAGAEPALIAGLLLEQQLNDSP